MFNANNLIELLFVSMLTYSFSSIWLFSPGFIGEFRELFISRFTNSNLKYLGICQLCSSFWFGILSYIIICEDFSKGMLLMLDNINILKLLIYAFISASIAWTFGAFTNMLLWLKAGLELWYNKNEQNQNK